MPDWALDNNIFTGRGDVCARQFYHPSRRRKCTRIAGPGAAAAASADAPWAA